VVWHVKGRAQTEGAGRAEVTGGWVQWDMWHACEGSEMCIKS
jgi:hypothetical protein